MIYLYYIFYPYHMHIYIHTYISYLTLQAPTYDRYVHGNHSINQCNTQPSSTPFTNHDVTLVSSFIHSFIHPALPAYLDSIIKNKKGEGGLAYTHTQRNMNARHDVQPCLVALTLIISRTSVVY